ncbi:CotY/CotZ family spore coat protein [Ectobacillus sp. sgz5001026]|uniref:CotY/CotZ family spore coat protein n=1 Tax=Ectobacillus sp. sgz5001026 TaxID=3242473 RepID=UPI0036D22D8F
MTNHSNIGCVCDVVKFINEIQDVNTDPGCTTNCLNPVLGASTNGLTPNTRVFSLYTKEGELFYAEFLTEGCDTDSSQFFRVESVEDCCAVLRVLKKEQKNMGICEFTATSQCLIVDLNAFIAIACIEDTFIPGV